MWPVFVMTDECMDKHLETVMGLRVVVQAPVYVGMATLSRVVGV